MMTSTPAKESTAAWKLAEVIEQSLQPANRQIQPLKESTSGKDYRRMLDDLGQVQTAREIQAAFSPY